MYETLLWVYEMKQRSCGVEGQPWLHEDDDEKTAMLYENVNEDENQFNV